MYSTTKARENATDAIFQFLPMLLPEFWLYIQARLSMACFLRRHDPPVNTLGFSAAEAKDGLEPNWALLKLSGVEERLVPKSLRDFS